MNRPTRLLSLLAIALSLAGGSLLKGANTGSAFINQYGAFETIIGIVDADYNRAGSPVFDQYGNFVFGNGSNYQQGGSMASSSHYIMLSVNLYSILEWQRVNGKLTIESWSFNSSGQIYPYYEEATVLVQYGSQTLWNASAGASNGTLTLHSPKYWGTHYTLDWTTNTGPSGVLTVTPTDHFHFRGSGAFVSWSYSPGNLIIMNSPPYLGFRVNNTSGTSSTTDESPYVEITGADDDGNLKKIQLRIEDVNDGTNYYVNSSGGLSASSSTYLYNNATGTSRQSYAFSPNLHNQSSTGKSVGTYRYHLTVDDGIAPPVSNTITCSILNTAPNARLWINNVEGNASDNGDFTHRFRVYGSDTNHNLRYLRLHVDPPNGSNFWISSAGGISGSATNFHSSGNTSALDRTVDVNIPTSYGFGTYRITAYAYDESGAYNTTAYNLVFTDAGASAETSITSHGGANLVERSTKLGAGQENHSHTAKTSPLIKEYETFTFNVTAKDQNGYADGVRVEIYGSRQDPTSGTPFYSYWWDETRIPNGKTRSFSVTLPDSADLGHWSIGVGPYTIKTTTYSTSSSEIPGSGHNSNVQYSHFYVDKARNTPPVISNFTAGPNPAYIGQTITASFNVEGHEEGYLKVKYPDGSEQTLWNSRYTRPTDLTVSKTVTATLAKRFGTYIFEAKSWGRGGGISADPLTTTVTVSDRSPTQSITSGIPATLYTDSSFTTTLSGDSAGDGDLDYVGVYVYRNGAGKGWAHINNPAGAAASTLSSSGAINLASYGFQVGDEAKFLFRVADSSDGGALRSDTYVTRTISDRNPTLSVTTGIPASIYVNSSFPVTFTGDSNNDKDLAHLGLYLYKDGADQGWATISNPNPDTADTLGQNTSINLSGYNFRPGQEAQFLFRVEDSALGGTKRHDQWVTRNIVDRNPTISIDTAPPSSIYMNSNFTTSFSGDDSGDRDLDYIQIGRYVNGAWMGWLKTNNPGGDSETSISESISLNPAGLGLRPGDELRLLYRARDSAHAGQKYVDASVTRTIEDRTPSLTRKGTYPSQWYADESLSGIYWEASANGDADLDKMWVQVRLNGTSKGVIWSTDPSDNTLETIVSSNAASVTPSTYGAKAQDVFVLYGRVDDTTEAGAKSNYDIGPNITIIERPTTPSVSHSGDEYLKQNITISASASDPDGDLTAMNIEVRKPDGSLLSSASPFYRVFSARASFSGSATFAPDTFGNWQYRVTAVDSNNRSRTTGWTTIPITNHAPVLSIGTPSDIDSDAPGVQVYNGVYHSFPTVADDVDSNLTRYKADLRTKDLGSGTWSSWNTSAWGEKTFAETHRYGDSWSTGTLRTLAPGTEYQIRGTATDAAGASVTSYSNVVTIANRLPSASFTGGPSDGAILYFGQTYSWDARLEDQDSHMNNLVFELRRHDGMHSSSDAGVASLFDGGTLTAPDSYTFLRTATVDFTDHNQATEGTWTLAAKGTDQYMAATGTAEVEAKRNITLRKTTPAGKGFNDADFLENEPLPASYFSAYIENPHNASVTVSTAATYTIVAGGTAGTPNGTLISEGSKPSAGVYTVRVSYPAHGMHNATSWEKTLTIHALPTLTSKFVVDGVEYTDDFEIPLGTEKAHVETSVSSTAPLFAFIDNIAKSAAPKYPSGPLGMSSDFTILNTANGTIYQHKIDSDSTRSFTSKDFVFDVPGTWKHLQAAAQEGYGKGRGIINATRYITVTDQPAEVSLTVENDAVNLLDGADLAITASDPNNQQLDIVFETYEDATGSWIEIESWSKAIRTTRDSEVFNRSVSYSLGDQGQHRYRAKVYDQNGNPWVYSNEIVVTVTDTVPQTTLHVGGAEGKPSQEGSNTIGRKVDDFVSISASDVDAESTPRTFRVRHSENGESSWKADLHNNTTNSNSYSPAIPDLQLDHEGTWVIEADSKQNFEASFESNSDRKAVYITVTKHEQEITADDQTVAYGDPAFNLGATTNSGLALEYAVVSGPVSIDTNGLITILGAGVAQIKVSQEGNYKWTEDEETITVDISKAPLTVTADNKSRHYWEADPEFTVTLSGLVYSDAEADIDSIVLETLARADSIPGDYPITVTAIDADYELTFVNGTLEIINTDPTATITRLVPDGHNPAWIYAGDAVRMKIRAIDDDHNLEEVEVRFYGPEGQLLDTYQWTSEEPVNVIEKEFLCTLSAGAGTYTWEAWAGDLLAATYGWSMERTLSIEEPTFEFQAVSKAMPKKDKAHYEVWFDESQEVRQTYTVERPRNP